jgi:hypothetical protein
MSTRRSVPRSAQGHLKDQLNVRVSDTAHAIIRELCRHHGITQSAVIEMLTRSAAREYGFSIPDVTEQYQRGREVDRT